MAEDTFGIVGTLQVGAYRVESVVAEGGFAVVYRAFHEAFRAPVALKCLKIPGQLTPQAQADFLEKFREEAELLFRLSASLTAVVRPLHVDVLATPTGVFAPFLALEWLEGEPLDAWLAQRRVDGKPPLALKRTVRMLTPVARALEYAHNFPMPDGTVSIVHRDLKPENIFLATVGGEQTCKIFDFGIAKVRSAASSAAGRATATGSLTVFTPAYAAPEQWLPKRFGQTGPWTDVWGLAITLVEMVAGHEVIEGDHAAMMGTAVDEKRRPTPRAEGVEVSDAVEAVFAKALAIDPRERHADVGKFWDALETALGMERSRSLVSLTARDPRTEAGVAPPREERTGPASRRSQDSEVRGYGDRPPAVGSETIPDLDLHPREPTPDEVPSEPPHGAQPGPEAPPAEATSRAARFPSLAIPMPPSARAAQAVAPGPPAAPAAAPEPETPALGTPAAPAAVAAAPAAAPAPAPAAPAPAPASVRSSPLEGLQLAGHNLEPIDDGGAGPRLAIDTDHLRSAPRISRASAARISPADAPPAVRRFRARSEARAKMMRGVKVVVAGLVVTGADRAYHWATDDSLGIGPFRLAWAGGAVLIAGIVLLVWALVTHGADA